MVPGGDPGFLEKARTQSRGGCPPAPPFMARSLPLARFGGCGTLSGGGAGTMPMYVPLIWGTFSCRAAQPRGFPLGGEAVTEGD